MKRLISLLSIFGLCVMLAGCADWSEKGQLEVVSKAPTLDDQISAGRDNPRLIVFSEPIPIEGTPLARVLVKRFSEQDPPTGFVFSAIVGKETQLRAGQHVELLMVESYMNMVSITHFFTVKVPAETPAS